MSPNQQPYEQQARHSTQGSSTSRIDVPSLRSEDWSDIQDPTERRKVQNRLAQRRFRDKVKEQKEDSEREAQNQRRAGGSYASPHPGDLDQSQDLSGLPWGGISMRCIVEAGKTREEKSRGSSGENSVYAASRTGGSSR